MEPPTQPPSTPAPFHPGRPSGGPSRTRPLLIGCAAVLVLLGIGMVVLIAKMPALVDWVFGRVEQQVMTQLPPDVTPEERQRLDAAFDAAAQAIADNKVDPAKARELNRVMMDFSSPRKITREEALELLRVLEEAAGTRTPAPSAPQ